MVELLFLLAVLVGRGRAHLHELVLVRFVLAGGENDRRLEGEHGHHHDDDSIQFGDTVHGVAHALGVPGREYHADLHVDGVVAATDRRTEGHSDDLAINRLGRVGEPETGAEQAPERLAAASLEAPTELQGGGLLERGLDVSRAARRDLGDRRALLVGSGPIRTQLPGLVVEPGVDPREEVDRGLPLERGGFRAVDRRRQRLGSRGLDVAVHATRTRGEHAASSDGGDQREDPLAAVLANVRH